MNRPDLDAMWEALDLAFHANYRENTSDAGEKVNQVVTSYAARIAELESALEPIVNKWLNTLADNPDIPKYFDMYQMGRWSVATMEHAAEVLNRKGA